MSPWYYRRPVVTCIPFIIALEDEFDTPSAPTFICIILIITSSYSPGGTTISDIVWWGQHGVHLGPIGPRWAPRWPNEPSYQRYLTWVINLQWWSTVEGLFSINRYIINATHFARSVFSSCCFTTSKLLVWVYNTSLYSRLCFILHQTM